MPILCLLAAIVIAALIFAAVYAFSYGIAKVALKVLPESDPNEGLPMCARKQQEVQDSWLAIAENGHNLRGEYAFQVQQERHCSWSEAIYIMICHDCEDMGIQVNHEYAANVSGYSIEQLNRRSLDKYRVPGTWESQPLPGHEGKTLTYAQAQEAMKNRKEHKNEKE